MAIAMKIRYVDPVCDDSLKSIYINGQRMGYQFDIRLACYRGHYLSLTSGEVRGWAAQPEMKLDEHEADRRRSPWLAGTA